MELSAEIRVDSEATRKELIRQETVKGNPLSIDVIYMQKFELLQDDLEENEFRLKVEQYAKDLLNNKDIGILFYKVQIFTNRGIKVDDSLLVGDHELKRKYILHFHAYAEDYLTKNKVDRIATMCQNFLGGNGDQQTAKLLETQLMIHKNTIPREPVYIDTDHTGPPKQEPGTEADTCCNKFINFWLIVPRAQLDFFNLVYQMYTFDITHQGFIPKFIHFFTIPINLILFFMFFAQFKLPGSNIEGTLVRHGPFFFPTNWSYLPLGLLVLAYVIMGFIRKCKTWGFATAVVITMLWGVGNLFYEEVRLPKDANATGIYREHWLNPVYLPYNPLIWSYIVSLVQAFSHMFVPQMPPYITGVTHWENLHKFLWHYNGPRQCCFKILAMLVFPILSVSVAYFSWPHLIGTEVFYIMAGIGYDHSFFKKFKLITEKAELSGNPRCAFFPESADTLMNPENPYREHLHNHEIIDHGSHEDEGKIVKQVASYHIYNSYFRGRHYATDPNFRDAHLYHYKAVNDHYFTLKRK